MDKIQDLVGPKAESAIAGMESGAALINDTLLPAINDKVLPVGGAGAVLGLGLVARQRVSHCMCWQGALEAVTAIMRCVGLLLHHCCSGSGKPGARPAAAGLLKAMRYLPLPCRPLTTSCSKRDGPPTCRTLGATW